MLKFTLALIGLTLPVIANAATLGTITVTGQNGSSQFGFQPDSSVTDSSLNTVNTSFTINGLMNNGAPGTMNYAVSATAHAQYGSLHASYSTAVTNVFHNTSNAPYDPSDGSGVPTTLSGQANASFEDTIAVTGGAGLSQIRLLIGMDGSLEQSSSSYPYSVGYAQLWQRNASGSSSAIAGSRLNSDPGGIGIYDQTVYSRPFDVINGAADINLLLQIYSGWLLKYIDQGENVSSLIDFSGTAQIIAIEGLDAQGGSVSISSALGASGTDYTNLSSVPIPAAAWLFGSALLGLGVVKRRGA